MVRSFGSKTCFAKFLLGFSRGCRSAVGSAFSLKFFVVQSHGSNCRTGSAGPPPPRHNLYITSFFHLSILSGFSPLAYYNTGFSCSTRRKRVTCVTHSTLGSLALTAGSFLRDITRVLLWMPLSGTLSLCTIFSHSSSHLFKFIFLNKQQYCFINGLRLF